MKLKIKLKQHTPLIHFQHYQLGATLRVSELKPKLDKFLIEQFGKKYFKQNKDEYESLDQKEDAYFRKGKEIAKKDDWLISGQEKALDYKVKVTISRYPEEKDKVEDIEMEQLDRRGQTIKDRRGNMRKTPFPTFFANMGNETEVKKFIFHYELELYFFSFNDELIKEIENNIAEFFANTNFGTRQSKGFGSFYLNPDQDKNDAYKDVSQFYPYQFFVDIEGESGYAKFKKLFESIDLFYRAMRSGINQKGRNDVTMFYFKSLMFLYAKNKGWQWDKKSIKEKFYSRELDLQTINHSEDIVDNDILEYQSSTKLLLKDLFGLSSEESWRSYYTSISKSNNDIDRFKSPIVFKPIWNDNRNGFHVYFKAFPINKDFLNQEFEVKNKKGGRMFLKTPKEFDFEDFFGFIFYDHEKEIEEFQDTYFNIENHVSEEFHGHRNYKILNDIFESINDYILD